MRNNNDLLKKYGVDPDEFLSEPSPKTTKRKKGRGAKLVYNEEPKEERPSQRLFQVLGGKARRKKLLSPKGMYA